MTTTPQGGPGRTLVFLGIVLSVLLMLIGAVLASAQTVESTGGRYRVTADGVPVGNYYTTYHKARDAAANASFADPDAVVLVTMDPVSVQATGGTVEPPPDPVDPPDPIEPPDPVEPTDSRVGVNVDMLGDNGYWSRMPWKTDVLWQANHRNGRYVAFVDADGHYPRGDYTVIGNGTVEQGNKIEIHGDPEAVYFPGYDATSAGDWHDVSLDLLKPFGVIRFLDWMGTNGNGEGEAPADMVDLCNATGAAPWFPIPDLWSDLRVREFFRFVAANLHRDLPVYVEPSNELWNNEFGQSHRIREGGQKGNPIEHDKWAALADRIFAIAREELGNRAVLVLAGQETNLWHTEQVLPLLTVKPDAISSAAYIGNKAHEEADDVAGIVAYCEKDLARKSEDRREWAALAKDEGMAYLIYEGGLHPMPKDSISVAMLREFAGSDDAGRLTAENIDDAFEAGAEVFCIYSLLTPWNQWGAFGHLEYYDEPTPRYEAAVEAASKGSM